jgi:hypothetical protein
MSTIQNANYGLDRIGGDGGQSIYEESSTPKHRVGEKLELSDGRVFRYAYFSTATAQGLLTSQDLSVSAIVESDNKLTAAAAGATEVTYTDSGTVGSATLNQYAGGYLHTTDDAGEGFQYRIKSSTAASSNAVTFTLYDGLKVAVTTATDVAVTGGLWNNLIGASATDYVVCGVTPPKSFTSGYYGWIQVRGIATALSDGTPPAGGDVMMSDAVVGAVEVADASHAQVGYATSLGTDTGYIGINIQLN